MVFRETVIWILCVLTSVVGSALVFLMMQRQRDARVHRLERHELDRQLPGKYWVSIGMVAPMLLERASEEIKQEFLPKILRGDIFSASLDDLRVLRSKLVAAGVEGILPICHGNAWSLYFTDCEGNGVECFVDSPFHVAQPFAEGYELDRSDEEILEATRKLVESKPEYQPYEKWQKAFAKRLGRS